MPRLVLKWVVFGALMLLFARCADAQATFLRSVTDGIRFGIINDIQYDTAGNLWVASTDSLVKIRPDKTSTFIQSGAGVTNRTIFKDLSFTNDGSVYVAMLNPGEGWKLAFLEPGSETLQPVVRQHLPQFNEQWGTQFCVSPVDGAIFFSKSTEEGETVYRVLGDGPAVAVVQNVVGFSHMMVDTSNNLWYSSGGYYENKRVNRRSLTGGGATYWTFGNTSGGYALNWDFSCSPSGSIGFLSKGNGAIYTVAADNSFVFASSYGRHAAWGMYFYHHAIAQKATGEFTSAYNAALFTASAGSAIWFRGSYDGDQMWFLRGIGESPNLSFHDGKLIVHQTRQWRKWGVGGDPSYGRYRIDVFSFTGNEIKQKTVHTFNNWHDQNANTWGYTTFLDNIGWSPYGDFRFLTFNHDTGVSAFWSLPGNHAGAFNKSHATRIAAGPTIDRNNTPSALYDRQGNLWMFSGDSERRKLYRMDPDGRLLAQDLPEDLFGRKWGREQVRIGHDGRMHVLQNFLNDDDGTFGTKILVRDIDASWSVSFVSPNKFEGFDVDERGTYYLGGMENVTIVHPDGSQEKIESDDTFPRQFPVGYGVNVAFDPAGKLYTGGYGYIHEWGVASGFVPYPTTVHSTNPRTTAYGWANDDVVVRLDATPSKVGAGVREIRYTAGGGDEVVVPGNTASFPVSGEGVTPIEYGAVGDDNQVEPKRKQKIRIDKTNPVASFTRRNGFALVTATDGLSGVDFLQVKRSNGQVGNVYSGTYQYDITAFWAFDKAGNRSAEVVVPKPTLKSIDVRTQAGTTPIPAKSTAIATIALDTPAPEGGLPLALESSLPNVIQVPASAVVPAGQTEVQVPVTVGAVSQSTYVTVSAQWGVETVDTSVTVVPFGIAGIYIPRQYENQKVTGRVDFNIPAPTSGMTLQLVSSNPSLVSVKQSVSVPAGASSINLPMTYGTVDADTDFQIEASVDGNSVTRDGRVIDTRVSTFAFDLERISGGNRVRVILELPAPAPAGGFTVALSSSHAALALPATRFIAAGQLRAEFLVPTTVVGAETAVLAKATVGGKTTEATLTVLPIGIAELVATPNPVVGGENTRLRITLSSPAPEAGVDIALQSSDPKVQCPATARIDPGKNTVTVTVPTLPVDQALDANIVAEISGGQRSVSLRVVPNGLQFFELENDEVESGLSLSAIVVLEAPSLARSRTVAIESNNPNIVVPATVTIPQGSDAVVFTIKTLVVPTEAIGTITARIDGTSLTQDLKLLPSSPLKSVVVSPSTFDSGAAVSITVNKAATSGTVDKIVVDGPFGSLEKTNVPGADTKVVFENVRIHGPAGPGTVTATCLGTTVTGNYRIANLRLAGIAVSDSEVFERRSVIGTVTLSAQAPTGGTTIQLASSRTALTVPATVTVAAGSTTATFTIETSSVSSDTSAIVTATGPSASVTASVKVINIVRSVVATPATAVRGSRMTVDVTKAPTPFPLSRIELETTDGNVIVKENVDGALAKVTFESVPVPGPAGFQVVKVRFEGETVQGKLTVVDNTVASLTFNPSSVDETQSATGTVTLAHPSVPGGTTVALASSTSAVVVPATVFVPEGATSATFTAETRSVVTTVKGTVSGTLNGTAVGGTLTVRNISVATRTTVSFKPSRTSYPRGTTITVEVKLNTMAGDALGGRSLVVRRYLNFTQSPLVLGTVTTNASGIATLSYTIPNDPLQDNIVIEAVYDGNPDAILNGASKGSRRIPIALQ